MSFFGSAAQFLEGNVKTAVGVYTGNPALVVQGSAQSIGAASGGGSGGGGGGALQPSNKAGSKDLERKQRAADSTVLAVNGDLASAQEILNLRFNSADAYGRQQYGLAWNTVLAQNPAIAQEALKTKINTSTQSDSPSVTQLLQGEWQNLVKNLKVDVANTVQRVGAGAATGAAATIDPQTNRITLPFGISSSTVIYVGIAIAALVGIYLLAKKR